MIGLLNLAREYGGMTAAIFSNKELELQRLSLSHIH